MVLQQKLDAVLIGHNYLNTMLAMTLIKKGKKILLIDDVRFNAGEILTHSLSMLDLMTLKSWAEFNQVRSLLRIEDYLQPHQYFIFIKKREVFLGNQVSANLQELERKYPVFFKATDVQSKLKLSLQAEEFCLEWSKLFVHFKPHFFKPDLSLAKLLKQSKFSLLLEHFLYFYQSFKNKVHLDDETRALLNSLTYTTRAIFHGHLSQTGQLNELVHLYLTMILPSYKVNHDALMQDFLQELKQAGGEFKEMSVGEFQLQGSIVKGMELKSFDGLIESNQYIFMGSLPKELDFDWEQSRGQYTSLNVQIQLAQTPHFLRQKKVISSSPMRISTDRPLFEMTFFEKSIEIKWVIFRQSGTKLSFVKESVLNDIKRELLFLFPEFSFEIKAYSMNFSKDLFLVDSGFHSFGRSATKQMGKQLNLILSPLRKQRAKNVFFIGPSHRLLKNNLGLTSTLIEIKKWQEQK